MSDAINTDFKMDSLLNISEEVGYAQKLKEKSRLEDVSTVIVGTCQIHPRINRNVFDSMQFDILSPRQTLMHSFQCGSSAEFYIEPINSCIDDRDIMKFQTNYLAFIGDIPVLPADFRGLVDTMCCFQIVPYSDYPGYVSLLHVGEMVYNWHCKKFQFHTTNKYYVVRNETPLTLLHRDYTDQPETFGPAVKCISANSDRVPCYWCPQWPKEAQNWLFRRRNYGWPTSANIRDVVQNGCHVVFAKHPACRKDERQWRLSFSAAEVILLQSWTPIQQIVYHILRFFAKRELIKKDCPKDDEVLSTYHFKTLMLWSCEEMSQEWWKASPVVEICCNLLRKLSEWLKKGYYPNYFISQANLLHEGMNQKIIDEIINRSNEFCHYYSLSIWFLLKYIKPILEKMVTSEDRIEREIDAGYCMSRICEIMDARKLGNFDLRFSYGFWHCALHTFPKQILETGYMFHYFLDEVCLLRDHRRDKVEQGSCLATVEFSSRFPQFGKVLYILHSANALEFKQITFDSDIFTEFIRELTWQPKVVRSKFHNFPKPNEKSLDRRAVLFLRAQDLMENLAGLNSPEEFKLLSRLSKELLRNALSCADTKSSAIRGVALVYMAALHFSESDYETAIEFCSTFFDNKTPGHDDDNCNDEEEVEEKQKEKKGTLTAGCSFWFSQTDYRIAIDFSKTIFNRQRTVHDYGRSDELQELVEEVKEKKESLNARCFLHLSESDYRDLASKSIINQPPGYYEAEEKENEKETVNQGCFLHFSDSDYEIALDISSTIVNRKTPGHDDDTCDNQEKVEEKETRNARCVLHLSESDYKNAKALFRKVFISQPPGYHEAKEKEEKETINAGCLFHIDDVATIVGFYLIFRRIKDNFQYNRRQHLDLRLTPEVFAHYLITSSTERRSKAFRQNYDLQPPTFPMDEILTAITNQKSSSLSKSTDSVVRVYQRTDEINDSETASKSSFANEFDIIQLLLEYSIENMTSFYKAICKDFGIHCNAADCYRAAYLYKCRKYPEVLQLCGRILDEPDLQRNLEEYTFANVMVVPPLDSYFDRDIQCLLGLHTLVFYLSPLNEDLCKLEFTAETKFQQFFARAIYLVKYKFSEILDYPYYLKCHYFLGRHFLARYLRMRIVIDCNHSNSEVLFEFKKLKSRLPFENIIRFFLEQKLR